MQQKKPDFPRKEKSGLVLSAILSRLGARAKLF